jgi:hypothetical protein
VWERDRREAGEEREDEVSEAAAAPAAAPAASAAPTTPAAPASPPASQAPATTTTAAAAPPKESPTPEARRFKINVKGEEREFEEKDVLRFAQKGYAAGEAFRAAAEERKRVEGLTARLRGTDSRERAAALSELLGSPEEVSKLGVELVKLEMIQAGIDPESGQPLDPRDQKMRELEQKLAAKEAQEKESEERSRSEQETQQIRTVHERWNKDLAPLIESKGMPVTPMTVGFVASHILETAKAAQAAGIDLDVHTIQAEAVDQASDDVQRITTGLLDAMPVEQIAKRYPGLVDKIRKHLVSQFKARQGQPSPPRQAAPAPAREDGGKPPPSMDEWRERMMRE